MRNLLRLLSLSLTFIFISSISLDAQNNYNKTDKIYNKNLNDIKFITKGSECSNCTNNCELVHIFKDDKLVDTWGSKCGRFN